MPRTGWWSSSRSAAARLPSRRPPALVLKLGSSVAVGLARSLLDEAVQDDARLRWAGDLVALAEAPGEALLLEQATFVVFDLETTGLRPGTARPCEIGAVRVRGLELEERFQTLANPGARLQPAVAALTGLRDEELRRAPPVAAGVRALPRVRGRRSARRAQRALRHGVPRQRDDAADRAGVSRRRSSTRSASRDGCSGGSRRTSLRSRTAS